MRPVQTCHAQTSLLIVRRTPIYRSSDLTRRKANRREPYSQLSQLAPLPACGERTQSSQRPRTARYRPQSRRDPCGRPQNPLASEFRRASSSLPAGSGRRAPPPISRRPTLEGPPSLPGGPFLCGNVRQSRAPSACQDAAGKHRLPSKSRVGFRSRTTKQALPLLLSLRTRTGRTGSAAKSGACGNHV